MVMKTPDCPPHYKLYRSCGRSSFFQEFGKSLETAENWNQNSTLEATIEVVASWLFWFPISLKNVIRGFLPVSWLWKPRIALLTTNFIGRAAVHHFFKSLQIPLRRKRKLKSKFNLGGDNWSRRLLIVLISNFLWKCNPGLSSRFMVMKTPDCPPHYKLYRSCGRSSFFKSLVNPFETAENWNQNSTLEATIEVVASWLFWFPIFFEKM